MLIYVITNNINGKKYVGQTKNSIQIRFNQHCKKSNGCVCLSRAIQKYGKENFTIEEIDSAKSADELNEKEIYWIAELNTLTPSGYNINKGGGNYTGPKDIESFSENRIGSKNPNAKKVININDNKVFDSIVEASDYYKVDKTAISACCRGKISNAYGYIWAFYDDFIDENFKINIPKKYVINLDTFEIFYSLSEAAEKYNIHVSSITAVCNNYKYIHTAGGCRWMRLKDYLDLNKSENYSLILSEM